MPLADVLSAPFSAVLDGAQYLAVGLACLGLFALIAAPGGRRMVALVARGRATRVVWLRTFTVKIFGREPIATDDASVARRGMTLIAYGFMYLAAPLLVALGAMAAHAAGVSDGKSRAHKCISSEFGTVAIGANTVNFCARLGDGAITYDATSRTWRKAADTTCRLSKGSRCCGRIWKRRACCTTWPNRLSP